MLLDLEARLPQLLPRAIAWAEAIAADVADRGIVLHPSALADAQTVGVQRPEKIRLLMVDQLPSPTDPELHAAAVDGGLLGPAMAGLTLGYAVIVRRACLTRRLLSHECRHVAQYEHAGSIASFLPVYLASIVQPGVGYWNSPYEQDARAHELSDA
jgi:hypothetical protein